MSRWLDEARKHSIETPEGLRITYDPALREAFLAAFDGPPVDLWPLFDALAGLPLALIRGANSDLLSAETVAEMRARRPDMLYAEVPDRAHIPFLDEPEVCRPDPRLPCGPAMTDIARIRAAADRLRGNIRETPLLNAPLLDRIAGRRVFVKAECLQLTGSFKARGGWAAVSALPEDARTRGVIAFSSGNHAQGVALAAARHGAPCVILMPSDAPRGEDRQHPRLWGRGRAVRPGHAGPRRHRRDAGG